MSSEPTGTPLHPESPSWSDVVARSRRAIEARQSEFFSSIGKFEHWHYTLDEGVIEFSGPDTYSQHRITVVGGASEHDGTWLWSWANESLPPIVTRGMELVRSFGEVNRYERMIQAEWPTEDPHVADVCFVAAALLDAQAYFRTSGGDVALYLLLDATS